MILLLHVCGYKFTFAEIFKIPITMAQTIFNTPESEYSSLPRIERLLMLRDSIQELIDDGVELTETLVNLNAEIEMERSK